MDLLSQILSRLKSGDGKLINEKIVKKVTITIDTTDSTNLEVQAWEGVKGSKTYKAKFPRKNLAEIVSAIDDLKYKPEAAEELHFGGYKTTLVAEIKPKQEEINELRNDSKEIGPLFGSESC